jgi:hypothetical protein
MAIGHLLINCLMTDAAACSSAADAAASASAIIEVHRAHPRASSRIIAHHRDKFHLRS